MRRTKTKWDRFARAWHGIALAAVGAKIREALLPLSKGEREAALIYSFICSHGRDQIWQVDEGAEPSSCWCDGDW